MLVELSVTLKKCVAIAITFWLLVAISGCGLVDPGPDGLANIRINEGSIEISVCTDIEVKKGSLEYKSNGEWTSAWEFSGSLTLNPGEQFELPGDDRLTIDGGDGMPVALKPGDSVEVFLTNDASGEYKQVWANFLLDSATASSADWINPDGATTKTPCS